MKTFSLFLLSFFLMLSFISCSDSDGATTANVTQATEFLITPINSADLSKEYESEDIKILESLIVSIDKGRLFVNSNEIDGLRTSVQLGDYINVRLTSSDTYSTTIRAKVSMGSRIGVFEVTTLTDTTPESFTLRDIVDATPNTEYTSNTITISGLSVNKEAEVSLTNGVIIKNGIALSERNSSVINGDTLAVRLSATNGFGSQKEAILSVGSVSDSFSVATQPTIKTLALSPSDIPLLFVAETKQLQATISPVNALSQISYSSLDRSVATVSTTGLVTAVHSGNTVITATSDFNSSVTSSVNVVVEAKAPDSNTTKFNHDGRDWLINPPSWHVSASEAKLIQIAAGFGNRAEPVVPIVQSGGVGFTQHKTTPTSYRFVGEERKFDIYLFDAEEGDNFQIDLRSSEGDPYLLFLYGDDDTIGTIGKDIYFDDNSGSENNAKITVYNVPKGRHIIIATEKNFTNAPFGAELIVTRIVQDAVTSILLSPTSLVLNSGDSRLLSVSSAPVGTNQNVVWSSSDFNVATISSEGNLTAVSAGTAIISAYAESNNSVIGTSTVFVDISSIFTASDHFNTSGSAIDIALNSSDTLAFVADSLGGLKVLGVTPTTGKFTSLLASLDLNGSAEQLKINRDDNLTYIATGQNGLQVVRASSTPSILDTYNLGYSLSSKYAWGVTLFSNEQKAIIVNGLGIDVIDVSSSSNVSLLSEINITGDTTYDIVLTSTNKNAFVALGSSGITVLDMQDIQNITSPFNNIATTGSALAVALSKDDSTLYVAEGSRGIEIIDVRGLSTSTILSRYDTPGSAVDVELSDDGSKLYIADTIMGVLVLDISNKIAPRIIEAYNSQGSTNSITKANTNDSIFISDGGNGALILK
jgi:hypothetical protein